MKRLTITLLSLCAIAMLVIAPTSANAQATPTAKITFRTLIPEGGAVNLIFKPADKIKVTGCHSITIEGGKQAWEVDDQVITLEGPITYFDCNMSRIVEMSFENCKDLNYLCVSTNLLKNIDLTGLSGLTQFVCNSTEVAQVTLGGNDALKYLEVDAGKLNKINLNGAPNLEKVSLSINQLATINLDGLNKLQQLDLSNNNLASIHVSNLPELREIRLSGNKQLSDASFEQCNNLEGLAIKNCKLQSFTAKDLDALTDIDLYNNLITKVTLENLPSLYSIDLGDNKLESVDFSKCNTSLKEINLVKNKFSGTFKLGNMPRLARFSISHNKISGFEIEGCDVLEHLNLQSNELESLDLSKCTSTAFKEVYAGKNKLSRVVLGNHSTLSLENNNLTSIDLSACTNLTNLNLSDNQLTELNLTGLNNLKEVYVAHNKIAEPKMGALIATLYKYEGDDFGTPTLYAVETRSDLEGNLCSDANVEQAKLKRWNVYDKRTYQAYNGAQKRTITCRTDGPGGKILLNGKEKLEGVYTETKVNVDIIPDEGYGLDSLFYRSTDIFKDQSFWVSRDGEVRAKFTDKICKVILERFGHGILKLDGEKFDLKRMPIGREIRVIADIDKNEEYFRELSSLTANDKDIMGSRDIELKGDTRIVARFDWLGDEGKDPYDGEYYCNIQEITRNPEVSFVLYPNPAQQQIFIENAGASVAISVYTLDGLRVMNEATDAEGRANLNIESLADGVYVVVIGNATKRMIVRR